jgi:hypothetical protein
MLFNILQELQNDSVRIWVTFLLKVECIMRFSERMGLSKPKMMQLDDMDDDLRNGLWNALYLTFFEDRDVSSATLVERIWIYFLKKPLDEKPFMAFNKPFIQNINEMAWIRKIFQKEKWYTVYDLVEFVANGKLIDQYNSNFDYFTTLINEVLKQELFGYRLINGVITPITSQDEIETIEEALESDHDQVKAHIRKALKKLSDRKNPDYRNSIKESISAVEAICKNITGESTLGKALNKINSRITLNPQLKDGLEKLYAYTNSQGGIRHSLMDEDNVSSADAKFMIVTCSAFCNYLTEKML